MQKNTDYVGTVFDNDSHPGKVTVAFTMANAALDKGHSATLIFMVDAVHLARVDGVDAIDVGEPFKPVKTLLEAFLEKGGRICVCKSCMVHHNITEEMIDARFDVITGGDVIDLTMNAKGTMQIS